MSIGLRPISPIPAFFVQVHDCFHSPHPPPPRSLALYSTTGSARAFYKVRHDIEEWNTCHKVFRPVNDFGMNLVGGIAITVQRGTVGEGTFTEFKTPHAQNYLKVRRERLAHSFDTV